MGLFSKNATVVRYDDEPFSGDLYPTGICREIGVVQRLFPKWYIISSNGRHMQDGDGFLFAGLRAGRLTFAFQFVAEEDFFNDDVVRVEFPEYACVRTFSVGADIKAGDVFVVQSHLDLKPALTKLGDGKVEPF